eukprot:TRINITY_DN92091_c0_g1_i1.p1 TRINITY_DN92091_c0_g1~~TRINITY_DN92091_c0_g1_i1.p1  ORF type:complete len:291 (-),score=48.23 TRINITY_DN92091_c0_g1_i1:161-1033(-)
MDRPRSRSREGRSRSREREPPRSIGGVIEESGPKETCELKYVDRKDEPAGEDRRAGMSHKPAWMTRGIGVNKEVFGETRGDLMKPGLTKEDLDRIEKQKPEGPDPFGDVFKEAKEEKAKGIAAPAPASSSAGSSFRSTAPLPSQDEVFGGKKPLPPQSAVFGFRPPLRPGCLGGGGCFGGPCGFGAGKGGCGFGQMLSGMMQGCGGCCGCGGCGGKGFGGGCRGCCGGGCKGGGCAACLGGFGGCGGFGCGCGGAGGCPGACQGGCGGCGGCGGGSGCSGGGGGCQGGCS